MPSGSGVIKSVSFTPAYACTIEVTATCTAQRNFGSDWGSSTSLRAFLTQGSTSYSEQFGVTDVRAAYTIKGVFSASGGSSVECGLYGDISGAVALTAWDIKIVVKVRYK